MNIDFKQYQLTKKVSTSATAETDSSMDSQPGKPYLPEVKQFISYYSICLHYQKTITVEQKQKKVLLNKIYHDMIAFEGADSKKAIFDLFRILQEGISDQNLASKLWKAAIKTIIKLLNYDEIIQVLQESVLKQQIDQEILNQPTPVIVVADSKIPPAPPLPISMIQVEFDLQRLIDATLNCAFDYAYQGEEEQIMLLLQKLAFRILVQFQLNEDQQFQIIKYFMKIIKKKAIGDESTQSIQFCDLSKRNFHKLLNELIKRDGQLPIKQRLIKTILEKISNNMKLMESKKPLTNKGIEYLCFMYKTIEDCLRKMSQGEESSNNELAGVILEQRSLVVSAVCMGCECDQIMIKNQAQQLFTFLLNVILDGQIQLREELEVMFVKAVLKPVLVLNKLQQEKDVKPASTIIPAATALKQLSQSTPQSTESHNDSDGEHEDFIQVNIDRPHHEEILQEMSINYLLETLLQLKPDQIGKLYLMYDCQPFAENLITQALTLLFRYHSKTPGSYFQTYNYILAKFQGAMSVQAKNTSGPSKIGFMQEQKKQVKSLAKDLNAKFKVFLKKISDQYSYIDAQTPAEVASKVLLYSRDIQIDKVAEVIGGKDDNAKLILQAYLNKLDYRDSDIEQSLRKFLQTYRLAGVDSQVINRILQLFSYKFHEMDKKGAFATNEEAYEFAYLIIVLQTCQHNPSVKQKTDISAFIDSAKRICPNSMDTFPPKFFENIYESVTKYPFYAPNSRSLVEENFNPYTLNEVDIRLGQVTEDSKEVRVTESQFVNATDLTQKQLFHYDNATYVPESLIPQANKYLLNYMTQRLTKYIIKHPLHDYTLVDSQFQALVKLVTLNKAFGSNELVDRLFQVVYKVINHPASSNENFKHKLEQLLWENFDCIKKSLVLIPKLSAQSFLRHQTKRSLIEVFDGVERQIQIKDFELLKDNKRHQVLQHQKSQSFMDIVYNYFTENVETDTNNESKKEEAILEEIRKRLIEDEMEGDYQVDFEENFEDKTGQQWQKEQGRMNELVSLICSHIRDNLNQEEGVLCLAFIEHIYRKTNQADTIEKLWVEFHLLMNQSFKLKNDQSSTAPGSNSSTGIEETKADYEVVSMNTSVDSISSLNFADDFEIFPKEADANKNRIYEALTRHQILQLHLSLSKRMIELKPDNSKHIVRNIKRLFGQLIDDNPSNTVRLLKTVDDTFLFRQLHNLLAQHQNQNATVTNVLKQYPKINKLIRTMLFLMLKSLNNKGNMLTVFDTDLLPNQLAFFNSISTFMTDLNVQVPYDLINLSIDALLKVQFTAQYQASNTKLQNDHVLELILSNYDNLLSSLNKHVSGDDDSTFELWFKIVSAMQEKVLFNPYLRKNDMLSQKAFINLKNAILNQPFQINQRSGQYIRKLFSDMLFWLTFENITQEGDFEKTALNPYQNQTQTSAASTISTSKVAIGEEVSENVHDQNLEAVCQLAIITLSDIFIYYVSLIFNSNNAGTPEQPKLTPEDKQLLFTYLWLNFIKILLHYVEKSANKDYDSLIQCVYDNIRRVSEFLVEDKILADDAENLEQQKLWKTSWEIIGAFFKDLKGKIVVGASVTQ